MRLLRTDTLALELFPDDRHIPPYAVLSHTWGAEEVTFQEMQGPADAYRHKEGFKKMKGCCRRALRDGLAYVWVDTCCIDKTSSAELSEAINSMFRWYEMSRACYVHLADVPADGGRQADIYQDVFAAYRACRWFTRGWTLQELLAPADVQFFDAGWNYIGSKSKNMAAIEKITGIRSRFLRSAARRSDASVAQRMSWAAGRQTTRREDRAYCSSASSASTCRCSTARATEPSCACRRRSCASRTTSRSLPGGWACLSTAATTTTTTTALATRTAGTRAACSRARPTPSATAPASTSGASCRRSGPRTTSRPTKACASSCRSSPRPTATPTRCTPCWTASTTCGS